MFTFVVKENKEKKETTYYNRACHKTITEEIFSTRMTEISPITLNMNYISDYWITV